MWYSTLKFYLNLILPTCFFFFHSWPHTLKIRENNAKVMQKLIRSKNQASTDAYLYLKILILIFGHNFIMFENYRMLIIFLTKL